MDVFRYQPSYRLESKLPYSREVCQNLLKELVDKEMKSYAYDGDTAEELCKGLCETIKSNIKTSKFDRWESLIFDLSQQIESKSNFFRYKLIVVVTLGEKFMQDIKAKAGFLWDKARDGFASYSYDRPDLFVIATVYAVYFE